MKYRELEQDEENITHEEEYNKIIKNIEEKEKLQKEIVPIKHDNDNVHKILIDHKFISYGVNCRTRKLRNREYLLCKLIISVMYEKHSYVGGTKLKRNNMVYKTELLEKVKIRYNQYVTKLAEKGIDNLVINYPHLTFLIKGKKQPRLFTMTSKVERSGDRCIGSLILMLIPLFFYTKYRMVRTNTICVYGLNPRGVKLAKEWLKGDTYESKEKMRI